MVEISKAECPATHDRIVAKLTDLSASFTLTTHEPVLTSEEAAEVRGAPLASGAKAILLKDCSKKLVREGVEFYLAVVSAAKRFSNKGFKSQSAVKNIRFATQEEVFEVTGCITGAVPPFASCFPKAEKVMLLVDSSLSENEVINFNCGLRTVSCALTYTEYARVEGVSATWNFTE